MREVGWHRWFEWLVDWDRDVMFILRWGQNYCRYTHYQSGKPALRSPLREFLRWQVRVKLNASSVDDDNLDEQPAWEARR